MNSFYKTAILIFVFIISIVLLSLSKNVSNNNEVNNEKDSINIPEIKIRAIVNETLKVNSAKKNILSNSVIQNELDSDIAYQFTILNNEAFRASDISSPNSLPEYLLNTPFLTLDVDYDELDELNEGDEFTIPIFPSGNLIVVISSRENSSDYSILKGVLKSGDIHFPASFTYQKNSIFGTVTSPSGEYRLSKISGVQVIYKIPELTSEPDDDALIFVPQTND
jgi:hypothetical protein